MKGRTNVSIDGVDISVPDEDVEKIQSALLKLHATRRSGQILDLTAAEKAAFVPVWRERYRK
jgi:hypothetical protein